MLSSENYTCINISLNIKRDTIVLKSLNDMQLRIVSFFKNLMTYKCLTRHRFFVTRHVYVK